MSPRSYRSHRLFVSRRSCAGLALACAFALCGALTTAAAATKAPAAGANTKRPARVTFIDAPSSETPAARKKRLKIECKGRPNAGMCLGYTR